MKRIALICMIVNAMFAYSQDIIHTHRGDTINCKVLEVGEKTIKFNYDGEDMVNSMTRNLVSIIKFGSGREEVISEKIIVRSEFDWEKVIITNVESDVAGLKRVDEIMAKASSGWSTTNQGKMEQKAMEKLKQQAAARGCHIVLILTTTGKAGHAGISGGTKASITGVAYKY